MLSCDIFKQFNNTHHHTSTTNIFWRSFSQWIQKFVYRNHIFLEWLMSNSSLAQHILLGAAISFSLLTLLGVMPGIGQRWQNHGKVTTQTGFEPRTFQLFGCNLISNTHSMTWNKYYTVIMWHQQNYVHFFRCHPNYSDIF